MLLIVAIVLLFVLSSPWNLVGFAVCLVLFLGELLFWQRTVRGRRAAVGADTLIGSEAKVFSPCRPDGQVQVAGEIWAASCAAGADSGALVRVVGRDGLKLVVEPM